MRENRQSGSAGGEAGKPAFPTPISTDDNLWRVTRRARGRWTKDKLSTRRGPVQSIGWFSRRPVRRRYGRGKSENSFTH